MRPKVFFYCVNFNKSCPRTEKIQEKFGEFIGLREGELSGQKTIRGKELFQEIVSYCEGCEDFVTVC